MIRHFPCCNMGRCFCERLQISAFASENQCQSQTDAPLFKKPLSSTDQRASTRCDISYPPKLTPQNCTLLDTCLRFVLGEPRSTETWSRNSHKGCRKFHHVSIHQQSPSGECTHAIVCRQFRLMQGRDASDRARQPPPGEANTGFWFEGV